MKLQNLLAKSVLGCSLFLTGQNCMAQSYRVSQVINLGGGETLQVVQCKETTGEQECELKHFRNQKQVGKNFWLSSKSIARLNVAQTKPNMPANDAVAKTGTIKKNTPKQNAGADDKAIARVETALTQAEMLAVARAVALQTPPPTTIIVEEKKEETKPQKEKKEFVSQNPFLLKQYKSGDATAKQEPNKE